MEKIIKSLSELNVFAKELAAGMKPGEVYGFEGDLGAGKTTLIQAIGKVLGVREPMTSPTFVFRKEYRLKKSNDIEKLIHVDAYRVERGSAEDLGELREFAAVTLIEWPEKLKQFIPAHHLIKIEILPDETRRIEYTRTK